MILLLTLTLCVSCSKINTIKYDEPLLSGSSSISNFNTPYKAEGFFFAYDDSKWARATHNEGSMELILVDKRPLDIDYIANVYIAPLSFLPVDVSFEEYLSLVEDTSSADLLHRSISLVENLEVGLLETLDEYNMHQIFMSVKEVDSQRIYTFSAAYFSSDDKRDIILETLDGFLLTLKGSV